MNPDGLKPISSLVARPSSLDGQGQNRDARVTQLAKDFESVLLTKLFDAMSQTTKLGSEQGEDSAGGQVQGLFWLYLAQDVADKGGLGLWKDLYRFFSDLQNPAPATARRPSSCLVPVPAFAETSEPAQSINEEL